MPESVYRLFAEDFGDVGTWYNVGLVVAGTGTPAGRSVDLYWDGFASLLTSLRCKRDSSTQTPLIPSPGLYFGTAVSRIAGMSAAEVAKGAVSTVGK